MAVMKIDHGFVRSVLGTQLMGLTQSLNSCLLVSSPTAEQVKVTGGFCLPQTGSWCGPATLYSQSRRPGLSSVHIHLGWWSGWWMCVEFRSRVSQEKNWRMPVSVVGVYRNSGQALNQLGDSVTLQYLSMRFGLRALGEIHLTEFEISSWKITRSCSVQ